MLIDCSYFTTGPRHIQNASLGNNALSPDGRAANAAIEAYIAEYQEPFLIDALGERLGNKVNAYLVCVDEGDKVANEKYDVVCERLKDAFADYVFFHIMRDSNTQQTMTGLVRLKCANEYVAPIARQVNIWNGMVNKNKRFAEWCASEDCPLGGISMSDELVTAINRFNL